MNLVKSKSMNMREFTYVKFMYLCVFISIKSKFSCRF